jgi:hypothetical protein
MSDAYSQSRKDGRRSAAIWLPALQPGYRRVIGGIARLATPIRDG